MQLLRLLELSYLIPARFNCSSHSAANSTTTAIAHIALIISIAVAEMIACPFIAENQGTVAVIITEIPLNLASYFHAAC